MPLVTDRYNPPIWIRNGHIATIYAGIVRKVSGLLQKRERINLPDHDFLDLDWSYAETPTTHVVILIHGLEGSAQRAYIAGAAQCFNQKKYDVCAINLRGCSGTMNTLYRSYHSGATEDIEAVVQHILAQDRYTHIFIQGYSLGGNLTLKYMGENRERPSQIKAAIAVSTPCDLLSSCVALHQPKNFLYAQRFKKHLIAKLWLKQQQFPNKISPNTIQQIKTLKDFDDSYTSIANGFKDALDYYAQSSSKQFLDTIDRPSLLINALNDSFLGPECYPFEAAKKNSNLFLETPKYGGHVGFYLPQNTTYTEKRSLKFFAEFAEV